MTTIVILISVTFKSDSGFSKKSLEVKINDLNNFFQGTSYVKSFD